MRHLMAKELDTSDIEWINNYKQQVVRDFSEQFKKFSDKFAEGNKLLATFEQKIDLVLRDGRSKFPAVDEAHNELCIALEILHDKRLNKLEYEPKIEGCAQSIDFRASLSDGAIYYIDVKTINPKIGDRWDQFERASKEGWFPSDVNVVLSKEWLGGEIWHGKFASRGRMLEYAVELENKISSINPKTEKNVFILALCGEGFWWHTDELEDFVCFYNSGKHRADDALGQAEDHYINEKKIKLQKTISSFACMRRSHGNVQHQRINWNVLPPKDRIGFAS